MDWVWYPICFWAGVISGVFALALFIGASRKEKGK